MSDALKSLAQAAVDQHGNVSSRQTRSSGLTAHQVRQQVRSGVFERAGAHVLRSPFVERTAIGDVSALVLDAGEGAVVSGPTALALHEFDGIVLRPPFHLTVPRGRYLDRPPHVIHTTVDLPPTDRTLVHGIPVMTAVRATIDASRFLRPGVLSSALDGALRDRKLTENMLHVRIAEMRARGRHGIPKLLSVIEGSEASRGGHSWLERRFLEICARHRLPRPETQQVIASSKGRLIRVDFRFAGTPVIGEVLGYRWHRGDRKQLSRDAERMNKLVRQGLMPMQFTYDHITLVEAWVVSELVAALAL